MEGGKCDVTVAVEGGGDTREKSLVATFDLYITRSGINLLFEVCDWNNSSGDGSGFKVLMPTGCERRNEVVTQSFHFSFSEKWKRKQHLFVESQAYYGICGPRV